MNPIQYAVIEGDYSPVVPVSPIFESDSYQKCIAWAKRRTPNNPLPGCERTFTVMAITWFGRFSIEEKRRISNVRDE